MYDIIVITTELYKQSIHVEKMDFVSVNVMLTREKKALMNNPLKIQYEMIL